MTTQYQHKDTFTPKKDELKPKEGHEGTHGSKDKDIGKDLGKKQGGSTFEKH